MYRGKILLAREQIESAYFSIDPLDPSAQIAIDAVKIEIALEDAGAALLVGPQCFHACTFRALRRDQAGHQRGADFAAMDVGAVQPAGVVPRRLKLGGRLYQEMTSCGFSQASCNAGTGKDDQAYDGPKTIPPQVAVGVVHLGERRSCFLRRLSPNSAPWECAAGQLSHA